MKQPQHRIGARVSVNADGALRQHEKPGAVGRIANINTYDSGLIEYRVILNKRVIGRHSWKRDVLIIRHQWDWFKESELEAVQS